MISPRIRPYLILWGALILSACGALGDKGKEPRGDTNLPSSGVGKFEKQDTYCNAEFVQSFIIEDPTGSTWRSSEPALIKEGDSLRLFFEKRSDSESRIYTTMMRLSAGTQCRDLDGRLVTSEQEIVFSGLAAGTLIGAPAVIKKDGKYRMWVELGEGEAIAYAEAQQCTPTNCTEWTLVDDRVLEPAAGSWENGSVGSPSVVFHDGWYRMWYDGNVEEERAIGHARSRDGINWIKSDAAGNVADAVGDPAAASVQPVLKATQKNWEFWYPDASYGDKYIGRVGQPCVIITRTPLRNLFLMYYTGNLSGRLSPLPFITSGFPKASMDVNIGVASSEDGLLWHKAPSYSERDVIANEINPIVAEKLPVSDPAGRPAGSINEFNPMFIVNEASPAVLEIVSNQFFIMLWQQTDWVNLHITPTLPGIESADGGFDGASGIGLAYTGNLPF